MDVPLLSQDEFFRHLNLQSVHAAAKFHYRHALKERLRASSIALRKERAERLANEKSATSIILETASPCKLLSPKSSNRLFGRPVIRKEVRTLKFDDFQSSTAISLSATNFETVAENKFEFYNGGVSTSKRPSILTPLFVDSRVFRHPGIKRELEERTKLNGFSSPPSCHFPHEDYPPKKRGRIEVRHCYYPKLTVATVEHKTLENVPAETKKNKNYRVSVRLQSTSSSEAVEWERKMAAALTLFGHPRKSDVLSTFPFLLLNASHRSSPHLMTSSLSGKRSPSIPPALQQDATSTTQLKESTFSNGHNNNNDKDLRLCLPSKLNNSSGALRLNGINLSPTVQLEKLPLAATKPPQSVIVKPEIPRGSRPLLHRKAKDEPPPAPPPPPAPIEKRKVVEVVKPVETSFVCPICQKCFSSAVSLLQHGEQTHLKCQSCGTSGVNSIWKKKVFDDIYTCQKCCLKRRNDTKSPVIPIGTEQHKQNALSTLEIIEQALTSKAKEKCHKCDICSKMFDRRSRMIRHMTSCHASDLHKVDLSKFAYNKKLFPSEL